MRVMAEDDERSVKEILHEVRQRVERRTFIQDVSEPLTGRVDQRKIAAKFNNIEHAVDELAEVVERVADEKSA
jgi:kynureninase